MRIYIIVLLILTLGSCTMQKRHYRKGWTINWKTERNSKDEIANKKDTSQYKQVENSLSSTTDHLDLIVNEPKNKESASNLADTISFENKQKRKNWVQKSSSLNTKKLKSRKSKISSKISLTKTEKKEKTGEKFFYFMAFMTFITGVLAFLYVSPETFSAIGVNSSMDAKIFTIIALSVFLILFIAFLVLGIKRRRDFKNKNNPNYVKPKRLVEKEKRVNGKKELAAAGIKNQTKLWLMFAAICVILGLLIFFLVEFANLLALALIPPLLVFLLIALFQWLVYRSDARAYFNGQYIPKKRRRNQPDKTK